MSVQGVTKQQTVDLIPWQAAAMILAVTLAGLVHQRSAEVRPLVQRVHASTGLAHAAALLNVAARPLR